MQGQAEGFSGTAEGTRPTMANCANSLWNLLSVTSIRPFWLALLQFSTITPVNSHLCRHCHKQHLGGVEEWIDHEWLWTFSSQTHRRGSYCALIYVDNLCGSSFIKPAHGKWAAANFDQWPDSKASCCQTRFNLLRICLDKRATKLALCFWNSLNFIF